MCAVWYSGLNCSCTEGPDGGNSIETRFMSHFEGVGLVMPRSACLCRRAVEVPVLICLRIRCNHVTETGGS